MPLPAWVSVWAIITILIFEVISQFPNFIPYKKIIGFILVISQLSEQTKKQAL
jgi:hypothetical protein